MLYSTVLLALSAFAGVASAQNFSTCCDINAGSVPIEKRRGWCVAERNTCPELCGGIGRLAPNGNNCDPVSNALSTIRLAMVIRKNLTCLLSRNNSHTPASAQTVRSPT
jgi:hypothetical protein